MHAYFINELNLFNVTNWRHQNNLSWRRFSMFIVNFVSDKGYCASVFECVSVDSQQIFLSLLVRSQ